MPVPKLILNDGTQVPWIAFGTGSTSFNRDTPYTVTTAIQNGYTHLEGVQMYKNKGTLSEGIAASGKLRSELYISTKLDTMEPGETPKSVLEESLKKLGLEYVDMYLVHRLSYDVEKLKEVWKGMEGAKKAGLTRSIGVSKFTANDLEGILEVATIVPAVNQVEAHPYYWKALGPTLAVHEKYGIVTSSYGGVSPCFRGSRHGGAPLDPEIEQIRARLEATQGSPVDSVHVMNRWVKQKGVLIVSLSSEAELIREYIDTENIPELTPEEIELIDAAGAKIYTSFTVYQEKSKWQCNII